MRDAETGFDLEIDLSRGSIDEGPNGSERFCYRLVRPMAGSPAYLLSD